MYTSKNINNDCIKLKTLLKTNNKKIKTTYLQKRILIENTDKPLYIFQDISVILNEKNIEKVSIETLEHFRENKSEFLVEDHYQGFSTSIDILSEIIIDDIKLFK